jgi:hypothetical protein
VPIRISARVEANAQPPKGRGRALLASLALFLALGLLLWIQRGFVDYALTGFSWQQAQGTVIAARNSSDPTIEFSTPDGTTYQFHEDYILLCTGRHSICFARNFTRGEQVPVIYKPSQPSSAYVHDWALTSTVIMLFVELGVALLLLLMILPLFLKRPMQAEIRIGNAQS